MHPQSSEKRIACRDFFDALERCHNIGFRFKWLGGCNQAKRELNKCLHDDSVARSARNRENAKLRNERREKALRELHEND
ncbi:hypothetical protein B0F90DRAFT_1935311 [Multifurca ochricompacta]|uniref:COX assembly mitochondrial protein n=1 Tax=Multifurca ochricompacta TaxID=376703 RepID=A0AAD4M6N8_9AGAM|nr:hypothetical protein B0F90DRAFT_1935311 [Multifurca ochricompacta]